MDDKVTLSQKLSSIFTGHVTNTPNAVVIAGLVAKEPKTEFRATKFETAIHSQKLHCAGLSLL